MGCPEVVSERFCLGWGAGDSCRGWGAVLCRGGNDITAEISRASTGQCLLSLLLLCIQVLCRGIVFFGSLCSLGNHGPAVGNPRFPGNELPGWGSLLRGISTVTFGPHPFPFFCGDETACGLANGL
jgi:hypothetical protein